jgi:hypothetical protein
MELGVAKVAVVVGELGRGEHALEHHRAGGEARDVKVVVADRALDRAADDEEAALELVGGSDLGRGGDQELADGRCDLRGGLATVPRIDRHRAPAEHRLPALFDFGLDQRSELAAACRVGGHEADRDAETARLGQRLGRDLELLRAAADEGVGDPRENAGAVAGARVGACRTAMLEVVERLERAHDDLVVHRSVETRDRSDPASIVLEGGVVKASLRVRLRLAELAHAAQVTQRA